MTDLLPASGSVKVSWWNRPRSLAVQLIAEDDIPDREISLRVKKSEKWLNELKRKPWVRERISEIRQAISDAVLQEGIAVKVNRIQDAQQDYDRLGAVIDARAADMRYDEPGYSTGLMSHKLRQVGAGKSAVIVDEYEVDTVLVAERRTLRRAVAEELAQLPRPDVHVGDKNVFILEVVAPSGHSDIPKLG